MGVTSKGVGEKLKINTEASVLGTDKRAAAGGVT